ncbi:MAG: fucose isomerase, partial [Thaumarchaeota archaeon]
LKNIPGYINDPSPDMDKGEVVYYHCQAPINPYGYDSKSLSPYTITPAHWNSKKLSVHVELPTNEVVTLIGLNPRRKILCIHTAKIIGNEYNQEECSTKAVGRADVKTLLKRWEWDAGWHRVLFYGDHREDLKIIARLLGLTILEEDR